jgi:hypothetical protein
VWAVALVIGAGVARPAVGADRPLVVELWLGQPPAETGTVGAEKVLLSPKLDRTQVEATEPTRMVTNVTKPTVTVYRPAKGQDTGTAVLICPRGRLLEPLQATGRRGGRGVAQFDRRDRRHPEVPGAAPPG